MHDFRWPALVTLGVLVLLFVLAGRVGWARGKYKIDAPATTGDPAFERVFRVQMNTLENTVKFLPALWLFAVFVSEVWAAGLGAAWIATRIWYAVAYEQEAGKRGAPFGISELVFAILFFGAAWGVVKRFM